MIPRVDRMERIEVLCAAYGKRRDLLYERLTALQSDLNDVKRRHLKEIKRCTALTAETESELRAAIEVDPDLFGKPKTRIFHGIKVGYRKGPGGLDWEDDDELVRKIEKLFPDDNEAEQYLIIKKKPSAKALEDLDAATLKRLGVVVSNTGDEVVVKAVETDIEKLVKVLLEDAQEDTE